MTERKLATVEQITAITPIADADQIVSATIRGWNVVVKKGEFVPGDWCVYFEIDSHLPTADPRFAFLAPRGVRTSADGFHGHVLKTARLRGTYSQGLALPLSDFPEVNGSQLGEDVTELLGIQKWDPPIPANIAGEVRGMRPSWIPYTDQERIQNIADILQSEAHQADEWIATLKIDGSSASFGVDPDDEIPNHVCSRNLDLKESDTNTLWKLAYEYDIHRLLSETWPGRKAVAQGEAFGEGIQGNPLKMKGQHLRLFNIVLGGRPLAYDAWPDWAKLIAVPIISTLSFPATVEQAVTDVDGMKAIINPSVLAEGVVWRHRSRLLSVVNGVTYYASFKVVSPRYLIRTGG